MSHYVQAFIGSRLLLERIQQEYATSSVVDLAQGLALLPLVGALYDAIPKGERADLMEENWHLLAPKIVELLGRCSDNEALGYFETAYFGGEGDQGAILARDGKIIYGPEIGPGCINAILSMMGVTKNAAFDEFAAVGLGRFRSNEKWLQSIDGKYPQVTTHLPPRDRRLKMFAPGWRPRWFSRTGRWSAVRKRITTTPLRTINTGADAKALAELYLRGKPSSIGELMIIDEKTIRKPYGWIFFYNAKAFLLTGNYADSLYGNGPLVVLGRFGAFGNVIQLGSSFDPEKTILHFEYRLKRFFLIYVVAVVLVAGFLIAVLLYFLGLL